jgi:hypothetical protein
MKRLQADRKALQWRRDVPEITFARKRMNDVPVVAANVFRAGKARP